MREFVDIQQELGLKQFLESPPLGTLHFTPSTPSHPWPRVMVRRFDAEMAHLAAPFASLMRAAQAWVDERPALQRLVHVQQPLEVGRDFVARPFLVYYTSTSTYVHSDDPPEQPPELAEMRHAFRRNVGRSSAPIDRLVESVLARSLLKPSGKTVFCESEEKFIVVEPKPTREELEGWA